jgi:hypothetical protein
MLIHDIADFLVNLTCKDIKPDIYSVFDSPCENNCPNNVNSEKLTILEILNAIGCRLKNLFGFVKINTTTETIDEGDAVVNVNGDVDNLNFDFKIPRGKTGPQGPQGEPGQTNLVVITATASASGQGEYIPDTTYSKALADIQANKAVMIKLENVPGRYYIPYSSSNTEILASAGTISGSKQSIELYTLKWTAQTNIITLTGTKKGCIADGGTTGQVLVKKSDESFDTEWKFQYRVILSNQPFNTAELIEQFNNGSLIYFYNIRTSSLYRIYNISNDSLYGINTLSINTTTRKITNYICKLQNNKFTPYEDTVYSVPNGGTSGQILAKKSNANGDTEWIDNSGGGSTVSVNVGETTTGEPGTNASVTNSGDETNVVLNFTIPRGNPGPTGKQGPAGAPGPAGPGVAPGGTTGQVLAKKSNTNYDTEWIDNSGGGSTVSVNVGETTTGEPGTNASVTNSGDETNVVLNFTIPRGNPGPTGKQGPAGAPGPAGPGVAPGGTTGQVLAKKSNTNYDTEWIDFYPYVPVGGVIEWDGTGIPNAPDLSTPEKVAAFYGYGTWERYGVDRVTIGAGGEYAAGSTGGEKEHTLTIEEMPRHNHSVMSTDGQTTSQTFYPVQMLTRPGEFTDNNAILYSGGSQPHNNMQPYIGAYKYRRIA